MCVFISISVIVLANGLAFFDKLLTILFCWHTLYFITTPIDIRNIQSIKFAKTLTVFEHKESRQTAISHKSVGSASYVRLALFFYSFFLMTIIFNFLTSIKFSCLHLGQKRGKFFNSVSARICNLVLFPQTGQRIHCKVCIESLPL